MTDHSATDAEEADEEEDDILNPRRNFLTNLYQNNAYIKLK